MVVHHADRLHERVADRGTDEFESAPQKIATELVGFGRPWRELLQRFPAIDAWLAADEAPHIRIEAAEFFSSCEERFRISNRAANLQPVSNDAGIVEQAGDPFRRGWGDRNRVAAVETFGIRVALLEDRLPAESRLSALERQHLEEMPLVVHRHAPFAIVIRDAERRARPRAASRRRHAGCARKSRISDTTRSGCSCCTQ